MQNPYRSDNPFAVVFGPLVWARTYGRLLYLLLCLPLGVAYFVFYVTGASLGVGLALLLAGLVILLAVVLGSVPLGMFERMLAIHLIGEPVPSGGFTSPDGKNFWAWLKETLKNRVTWTSMAFLVSKFPLGLVAWVATIVALSVSVATTAAPLVMRFGGNVDFGFWAPTTPSEAMVLVPVGLAMIVLSAHLVNGMGWAWGKYAGLMLGRRAGGQPVAALAPAPEAAPQLASGMTPSAF